MGETTKGLGVRHLSLSMTTSFLLLTILSTAVGRELPFTGIVVDAKARTYCRAGGAYVTGELDKDTLVRVEKIYAGWYQIVAPQGSYSFISKDSVEVKGEGKVGVVNRDRVGVRAVNVKDKGNSYYTQVSLVEDTQVQILGEYGSFYMIVPPPGAYIYLRESSVVLATHQQIDQANKTLTGPEPVVARPAVVQTLVKSVEPTAPDTTTSQLASPAQVSLLAMPTNISAEPDLSQQAVDGPADTVPSLVEASTKPSVDAVVGQADQTPPAKVTIDHVPVVDTLQPDSAARTSEQSPPSKEDPAATPAVPQLTSLADVERRFDEASQLPLDQQPVEELRREYVTLSADPQLTEKDKELVDRRLKQLHRYAMLTDTFEKIEQARRQDSVLTAPDAALKAAVAAAAQKGDTVGYLLASNVYNGSHLPRLYRLVDSVTRRTIGYVRPEPPINPRTCLGRIVSLSGKPSWDRQLKVNLFKVERIEVMRLAAP